MGGNTCFACLGDCVQVQQHQKFAHRVQPWHDHTGTTKVQSDTLQVHYRAHFGGTSVGNSCNNIQRGVLCANDNTV